nr:MAG TPA_asm: hypothetical protein [Caudoviricetes sp.]
MRTTPATLRQGAGKALPKRSKPGTAKVPGFGHYASGLRHDETGITPRCR